MMKCKICESQIVKKFVKKLLKKYDVSYYECISCGFVQTESPFWLSEAYESAITNLDIGMLWRANECVDKTLNTIDNLIDLDILNPNPKVLDFAGGYGVFTRKMRDNGIDTYWQDDFCENIFAKHFEYDVNYTYDLVTAFEVFEHVVDPVELIERLTKIGRIILFTTELVPKNMKISDWWYVAPSTGQHISFYTEKSLKSLGNLFQLNYYRNGNYHLFMPKEYSVENPLNQFEIKSNIDRKIFRMLKFVSSKILNNLDIKMAVNRKYTGTKRDSLLNADYEYLRKKIG